MQGQAREKLVLVVPKLKVKYTKDLLEKHDLLDKTTKIRSLQDHEGVIGLSSGEEYFCVPTTKPAESIGRISLVNFLQDLEIHLEADGIYYFAESKVSLDCEKAAQHQQRNTNVVGRALDLWVQRNSVESTSRSLSQSIPHSYMIYGQLLLLSPAFVPYLLSVTSSQSRASLLEHLCTTLHVTHIAANAPIPLSKTSSTAEEFATTEASQDVVHLNIFRSPTGLVPLHGDFGPLLPAEHVPSRSDLERAFWCSARQNDIVQTWAPRFTMFSRGNVTEKARVLSLTTLTRHRLGSDAGDTTAVDLYAGIGYFAFSYARAGVGKVVCWEINPWSIEGLKRGAESNKWSVAIHDLEGPSSGLTDKESGARIVVYPQSNEHAAERINSIRSGVPPVRHVNCGYLPSSKDSWKVAVEILDPIQGGWIHAHENVAKKDIAAREREIVAIFMDFIFAVYGGEHGRCVCCEHVERVKSYAPGVIHCVFDIAILPGDP